MHASVSFAEYATKKKRTHRDIFLEQIEASTRWAKLKAEIEPFYAKGNGPSRLPIGLSRMLCMYITQQCFSLSDEGIGDAIYDSQAIRHFVGIDLTRQSTPDATTLLQFQCLLETHNLTEKISTAINTHLAEKGCYSRRERLLTPH